MKANRIHLSVKEYATINHITTATKTDCWFSLSTDREGFDCVYDLERRRKITLRYGVKLLREATEHMTVEEWSALRVTTEELKTFYGICDKLRIIKPKKEELKCNCTHI